MMPYGLMLIPFFNWMSGGAINRFKSEGLPIEYVMDDATFLESVAIKFYQYQINERQILHMKYTHGGMWIPRSQQEYESYFDTVERQVPKERLMIVDVRTVTYKQLCDFVGIQSPKCTEDV